MQTLLYDMIIPMTDFTNITPLCVLKQHFEGFRPDEVVLLKLVV
jgi:hypothetical protein